MHRPGSPPFAPANRHGFLNNEARAIVVLRQLELSRA